MRREEAAWIGQALDGLPGPVLDLGSQTLVYRTVLNPHIEALIYRGHQVVAADLQSGPGIDVSGDFLDPATQAKLKAVGARTVLCNQTLPYIRDPQALVRLCLELVPPGGSLIASAPSSFPYTRDPVDNGLRVPPQGLAAMFDGLELVSAASIPSVSFWGHLKAHGDPWRGLAVHLAKAAALKGGVKMALSRLHRLLWLGRPYTTSIVLMRRPSVAG